MYNIAMKFVELKKRIKSGDIQPIYLLTGDDAYVIEKAYAILQSLVTDFPELNISRFEENADPKAILASCLSVPMLSYRRIVCVRDFKASLEPLDGYFKTPCSQTVLVFISQSLTPNLGKYVKSMEIVECNKLTEAVLTAFIAKDANARGCQITVPAAKLLIEYCASSLARIESETEKLCQITQLIKEQDVIDNVNADVEYKIFELSNAITAKDSAKVLEMLKTLMFEGYAPAALLGMLQAHFRRLMYVTLNRDDDTLASKLSVKEGAIYAATKQSKNYSPVTLKKICDGLAEDEYKFKSGLCSDRDAIYNCVLRLVSM